MPALHCRQNFRMKDQDRASSMNQRQSAVAGKKSNATQL